MNFIDIDIFTDRIEFDIYSIDNQQKIGTIKDKIIIPKAFDIGDKLSYIRKVIDTFVRQGNVKNAHINSENNLDIDVIQTLKIEGVIEELFSNSGVEIWR
ncbi:MAG: hypothetical protein RRZ84_01030 [Romboutsia sp.]